MNAIIARRAEAVDTYFSGHADAIAGLCSCMAERFASGGRLLAAAAGPAARSDARHVAVEFVHPVIVGKRALPAFSLAEDPATLAERAGMLVSSQDMLIAFGGADDARAGVLGGATLAAKRRGALTIGFDARLGSDHTFAFPVDDPFVQQELAESCYHILWELVHVFFEHAGTAAHATGDLGASEFLYPFLTPAPADTSAVLRDVAASVRAKADDCVALRRMTLTAPTIEILARAADGIRDRLDRGGTILAIGNGGSATDAMDFVADLRTPPTEMRLTPRRALDLTDDTSILTAIANDVGPDLQFSRQIIAYARPDDVLVAFSTSGNSRNIVSALDEARRRGTLCVAFVGYDGGAIANRGLAEHIIIAPSQHIPRIQEAHAAAYHLLRMLIG